MTSQISIQTPIPKEFETSLSDYKRYHIENFSVDSRKKMPHPFWPKIKKFGLIWYLTNEALHLNVKLIHKKYRKVLFQRPCIYGVFGRPVGGLAPVRHKCVGCMRCVQEVPNVCSVERNKKFYTFGDSFWIPENMKLVSNTPLSLINFEASSGSILVKGMGYKGTFGSERWDAIWTDMSEIVRPTRDGVYGREFICMAVDLGSRQKILNLEEPSKTVSRTFQSPIPIIFDNLPENISSKDILTSISTSALATQVYYVLKGENIQSVPENTLSQAILLLDNESDMVSDPKLIKAPIVELTTEFSQLYMNVRKLRPNKPIALRLKITDSYKDIVLSAVEQGFDIIHIETDYHGMSYESKPRFIKDVIREIHQFLVEKNIRDQVSIISSGGIILAEHVPKAIICGSDAVAINTTILIALQNEFIGELRFPDKSKIKNEKLDPVWGTKRLSNVLSSWYNQTIEILSAMGIRDVRRLRGDVGRAIFKEDIENEAFIDLEVV